MTNPHPTGSDAISDREIEKAACASWPLVNPDDHWSSPANSVTKNRHVEVVRAVALSLHTPKGKHIEDVYPDEAVAWRWWDTTGYSSTLDKNIAAQVRSRGFIVEPLFTVDPPQLLAAKQQGIAEERERCAKIAANFTAYTWRGNENENSLSGMFARGNRNAATSIAAAIRGAS